MKTDLLSRYGGVAPKMAEEAHSLVIDQVWLLVSLSTWWCLFEVTLGCMPLMS